MTIYELAQHLGLSVSTTSKALNGYPDVNEETRKRVLRAAEELGYQPSIAAQSITTKRSYLVGVLYVENTGIGLMHPHFSEILEYFKQTIEQNGYQLMFISQSTGDVKRTLLQTCRYRSLDGLLIMAADRTHPEVVEILGSDIPAVLVDFAWPPRPSVISDNIGGIRMVADYLVSLGHREFVYLAGPIHQIAFELRKEGLIAGLLAHGISLPEERICASDGMDFQGGYEAMESMLPHLPAATAVIGAYDDMTIGALCCLRDHGIRVPEDVSITGFDNIINDQVDYWQLTTVEQPRAQIGTLAAEQLLANMQDKTCEGESVLLPVRLVERSSCRRI